MNGYSMGADTLLDQLISSVGGYNVLRDVKISGFYKINEELVITLQPDVILLTGIFHDVQNKNSSLDMQDKYLIQFLQRLEWQQIPAVIRKKVYFIPSTWSHTVSQFSWDGLTKLAEILHPNFIQ